MPLRLQLFGAPALEHDVGSIALPPERRSQLLVLLALRRGWVGRAELAALLWPEQTTKLAYSNLRKTLFRLHAPPWNVAIETQGSALRLEADTDVADFEAALRAQQFDTALALRRGELLSGFDDDANDAWSSWLHFERDRLRAAWRGAALERLAGGIDAAAGIELSARLLDADPLDEAALRVQLGLLAQTGQGARARQLYREFVARLADELGLTPGAELQALHDALGATTAAGVPAGAPSLREPVADAGFIGRSVERQRIAELLGQGECRLLCLVGPGGIGKTRLAQRALLELAPGFADGSHLVRLEDVGSAVDLAARVARDAGLALRGRGATIDQLCAALRERRMLLVLDNFEQLVEAGAAPLLETLLAASPHLKLIVTSRLRLGLSAEYLLPLEGLPCPEREDADRLEAFDAARLFIAAAQRVEPALVPSAEAMSIVDICRLVDGLPLALELAAAWTRVLSCEAIAAELREGTALLRADDASHPPRHASIEQVFEQSWRRLAPAEREALACLSVFQGGFSAEAARAVAGTPLPVLGALADKSLLRKDGARLSLHPLVQQLAAARLDPAALAQARHEHADYFQRVLLQLRPAIDNGERAALHRVDLELENARRAWQWLIVQGRDEAVRSVGATLQSYFDHRGRFEDGLALMRQAIDAPPLREHAALQTWLLGEAAHFEYRLDRYAEAEALAERALAAQGAARDRGATRRAHDVLGTCKLRLGHYEQAREHFQTVLALATEAGQDSQVAATLDHLALAEKRLGHYDRALELSLDSLARHRRIGDSASVALCLCNLGSLYITRGDVNASLPSLHEALAIGERDGLTGILPFVLGNLCEAEIQRGELAPARVHAERAAELARDSGNRSVAAWMLVQRARLAQRSGDLGAARALLGDGARESLSLGMPFVHGLGLLAFAELLRAQGNATAADRVLGFVVEHPSMAGAMRDSLLAERRRWGLPDAAPGGWPGLSLEALLQRVSVEAPLAHAPLIAQLQGAQ